ncbi:MAG: hypothetical protein JJW01_02365 [Alphaproteobacteria bacterium]|nr:hypothetical protein [Rickettsiales bacterium]
MSHKEMLEAMITGKELKGSREYARHRYIVGTDKRPAKIPKEDQRDYRLYKE